MRKTPGFSALFESDIAHRKILSCVVRLLFLSARSDSVFWHFTGTLDSNKRIVGYLIVVIVIVATTLISGVEYFVKNWDVLNLSK